MTNEMKLLTELCRALGFTVEVTTDYKEQMISQNKGHEIMDIHRHSVDGYTSDCSVYIVSDGGTYKRGPNGEYYTRLAKPEITYKLTKKAQ